MQAQQDSRGNDEGPVGWMQRLPRDAPLNLAIFRIVVGLLLMTTREAYAATQWAHLPSELAVVPRGWGWALALVPVNPLLARTTQVVLLISALMGALGCFTRVAFAVATLAGLYLLSLPLRSGMPFHYQHLIWFAALCAASPSADALSIDWWFRRRRGQTGVSARSPAYGVPIRVAWILIGMVFFFPGLWKLRAAGLAWITSDNLRNQLYWKWTVTPGLVPLFRVDRFPWLLHLGAAAVVILELAFAFAVWRRSFRMVAVTAALIFHASAWLFMGIDFSSLWLTYVVFIDWDALVRRLQKRTKLSGAVEGRLAAARIVPALAVGLVLVVGAAEAGVRGATMGWPFACYPTFQDLAGTEMPALAVSLRLRQPRESTGAAGVEVEIDPEMIAGGVDAPRERAFGLRLIAAASLPGAETRFAAYWARLADRPAIRGLARDAQAVRFYAARISTLPAERDRLPRKGRLLYELLLDGESSPTMMPRSRKGAMTWPASDSAANSR